MHTRWRFVFLASLLAACGPDPDPVMPHAERTMPDAGVPKGLRFAGNTSINDAELRQTAGWIADANTSPDQALTLNAERVQELYLDRGYLDVKVEATDVVHDASGAIDSAAITIKEGKRYKIGELHLRVTDGAIPGLEHDTLAQFKSRTGGWFLRKEIREDISSVALAFQDQGYAAVSVEPELTMHPENASADIMLVTTRRTRATFHDVSVLGNYSRSPEALRKAFTFKEGDWFSETRMNETRQNLFELFGKQGISLLRNLESDPSHVVVQFQVYEPGTEMPPARPRVPCPAHVDISALLDKNARAYGAEAAVRAALPHTFKGYIETQNRSGDSAFYVDAKESKLELSLGGVDPFRPGRLPLGSGVDRKGPWELGLSGEVVRLGNDVSVGGSFLGWLFRREYLTDAARRTAKAECRTEGSETSTQLTFAGDAGEGVRKLEFDPMSGELLGFEVLRRGVSASGKIVTWSAAGADGVRWPVRLTVVTPINNDLRFTSDAPGLGCGHADCTAAMPAHMSATWPAKGVVTVPFKFFENELFVRAKVDDRDVWAVLDSGASLTSVDTTMPIGASQKPVVSLWARGSTQGLAYGVNEVSRVSLGDLVFHDMPVASAPLPVLAAGGVMRAEAILGIAFFQEGAVRVDYAKQELTFARDASLLPARPGPSIPTLTTWDMISGPATVGGKNAVFQLDTGNGNGVNVEEHWAAEAGLPGSLPIVQASALTGAGERVTLLTMFRVPKVTVGPIHYDNKLVSMNNGAPRGGLGGFVGNDLFARCDAITFDPKRRTLAFHGKCDRARPETKTGWHVERRDDEQFSQTPWVITALLPGTAADVAGVMAGDRLLEAAGKQATLDRQSWDEVFYGAEGTKVSIVVLRNGAKKTIEVTLRSILK